MQGNASLTAKQLQLITALAHGSTVVDAAKACKVNESTAHRWLRLAAVQDALKTARKQVSDEIWADAMQQLKDAAPLAIEVLKRHAGSKVADVTGATQLASARYLIDKTTELNILSDLERRLKAMEDALDES